MIGVNDLNKYSMIVIIVIHYYLNEGGYFEIPEIHYNFILINKGLSVCLGFNKVHVLRVHSA